MAVHSQLAQTASRHPVIIAVGVAGVMQVVFPGAFSRIIPTKLRSALLDMLPSESPLLNFPTQLRPLGLAFIEFAPRWKPSTWGSPGEWPNVFWWKAAPIAVPEREDTTGVYDANSVGGAMDESGGVALDEAHDRIGNANEGAEGQGGQHQHDHEHQHHEQHHEQQHHEHQHHDHQHHNHEHQHHEHHEQQHDHSG